MEPSSVATKAELRQRMLEVRRSIDDRASRSERIRTAVAGLDAVRRAKVVVAYDALAGEPDLGPLFAVLVARGVEVRNPEALPSASAPDLDRADVVVVPGVAFTASGHRLGRGAGWYDQVLAGLPGGAMSVGVCFESQMVDHLPTEAHDVPVHAVVTDQDVYIADRADPTGREPTISDPTDHPEDPE